MIFYAAFLCVNIKFHAFYIFMIFLYIFIISNL